MLFLLSAYEHLGWPVCRGGIFLSCQLYAGVTSLLATRKSAGIGGLHLSVDALWWLPGLTGNALGLNLFYLPQRRLPTRLTEEPWFF